MDAKWHWSDDCAYWGKGHICPIAYPTPPPLGVPAAPPPPPVYIGFVCPMSMTRWGFPACCLAPFPFIWQKSTQCGPPQFLHGAGGGPCMLKGTILDETNI